MWRHDPNVITISDSLLTALPTLLGLGNATQVLAGEEEAFEPPSLVVSLEHDHLKPFNKDWKKEKLSRGMQIIQVSAEKVDLKALELCALIMSAAVDDRRSTSPPDLPGRPWQNLE